ncbi:MAG: hypothetical protein ACTSRI_11885 [Promethearchaeota archaeon]
MTEENDSKVKVDIFVPLNVCACQWEGFMNSVFEVLTDYLKYVSFETKSLNSEQAHELNLHGNSVVIDGNEVITSSFALKKKLPIILKEKGLV